MSLEIFKLDGCVAVVTGCNRGLGFVMAKALACAIVFLASDASSFMTGAALTVDGGWTAE